jgi:hypothetical protein
VGIIPIIVEIAKAPGLTWMQSSKNCIPQPKEPTVKKVLLNFSVVKRETENGFGTRPRGSFILQVL